MKSQMHLQDGSCKMQLEDGLCRMNWELECCQFSHELWQLWMRNTILGRNYISRFRKVFVGVCIDEDIAMQSLV
jgi:hypothetical protein